MNTTQTLPARIKIANLQVAKSLFDLIQDEAAPGTGIEPVQFWTALAGILGQLSPKNRKLLQRRDELQAQLDDWHRQRRAQAHDPHQYATFLRRIGYLEPAPAACYISPQNVDAEIAQIAGPQLVVPVNNARYALNAANARWGSLFDALYGTDALGFSTPPDKGFDVARGTAVVTWAMDFLDEVVPLTMGSHADVSSYRVKDQQLVAELYNGQSTTLAQADKFAGYRQTGNAVDTVLLCNNNLHIEIRIDQSHPVAALSRASIRDINLESAITTIQDCEDSVAAVDAEDKVTVYRHWLQLMNGTLHARFSKDGKPLERRLHDNRHYLAPDGSDLELPGRSLMLIRNVGIHMTTDAVLTADGEEIYEGILDCMVTALCAMHDLRGNTTKRNSRTGSMYLVKPKLHGPEETAFTVELLHLTEQALGLAPNTIKLGIMDEERRTTLNLKACIQAAASRVIFINTGFLDRTGDEIHTCMEAGPVLRKTDMKNATWLLAYEDWNVDTGLACGFMGKAQIGKGMWTRLDRMQEMLQDKLQHPRAGANCAWVPSPTAATLHAIHYHKINVTHQQQALTKRTPARLDDLLQMPVVSEPAWSADEIQQELNNNIQSILGYVVRWVEHGIGASKVPDINHINLMEDRATLRISSQHIANWLHHGIVTRQQVLETLVHMAEIVDEQNADTPDYRRMAPQFNGPAFNAARDLIFNGREAANGYTVTVLRHWRRIQKAETHH